MTRPFLMAFLLLVLTSSLMAAPSDPPKTLMGKASYLIGHQIGMGLARQGAEVDEAKFRQGFMDALAGKDPVLPIDEIRKTMMEFNQLMRSKAEEKRNTEGKVNADAGKAFQEKNKARKGVKVTSSGLQYEVVTAGKGDAPKATDRVKVHYRGTLLDGKEFDSSYKRGKPAEFALNRVIRGWTEGVQLMKPGAKYKFVIPADLAYGERGAPPRIGPNSTLCFEVELMEVMKEEPQGMKMPFGPGTKTLDPRKLNFK